jgi:hypothetical protein
MLGKDTAARHPVADRPFKLRDDGPFLAANVIQRFQPRQLCLGARQLCPFGQNLRRMLGPAAIEMQCQCRRADGQGLSRDGLGDGLAINADGLSHRVRPYGDAVTAAFGERLATSKFS